MKKNPIRSALVDKLHKGFVLTCLGVTIYGCAVMGMRYYNYIIHVKPKKLLENQSLLSEGASDILKDSADVLKS